MSTHNIGFYGEISKIILLLSNFIYPPFCSLDCFPTATNMSYSSCNNSAIIYRVTQNAGSSRKSFR